MISESTLRIKNFPSELSDADKQDFFEHFGATHVKIFTSKVKNKSVIYAKFKTNEKAKTILAKLHQYVLLNSCLSVEFAKNDIEDKLPDIKVIKCTNFDVLGKDKFIDKSDKYEKTTNRGSVIDNISENSIESSSKSSFPDKKHFKTYINKLNSFNHSVAFHQPPPSHLKYVYPKPNRATLSNIAHALATVPKFYTQVLHLMNKMNLPPPFSDVPDEVVNRTSGVIKPQIPVPVSGASSVNAKPQNINILENMTNKTIPNRQNVMNNQNLIFTQNSTSNQLTNQNLNSQNVNIKSQNVNIKSQNIVNNQNVGKNAINSTSLDDQNVMNQNKRDNHNRTIQNLSSNISNKPNLNHQNPNKTNFNINNATGKSSSALTFHPRNQNIAYNLPKPRKINISLNTHKFLNNPPNNENINSTSQNNLSTPNKNEANPTKSQNTPIISFKKDQSGSNLVGNDPTKNPTDNLANQTHQVMNQIDQVINQIDQTNQADQTSSQPGILIDHKKIQNLLVNQPNQHTLNDKTRCQDISKDKIETQNPLRDISETQYLSSLTIPLIINTKKLGSEEVTTHVVSKNVHETTSHLIQSTTQSLTNLRSESNMTNPIKINNPPLDLNFLDKRLLPQHPKLLTKSSESKINKPNASLGMQLQNIGNDDIAINAMKNKNMNQIEQNKSDIVDTDNNRVEGVNKIFRNENNQVQDENNKVITEYVVENIRLDSKYLRDYTLDEMKSRNLSQDEVNIFSGTEGHILDKQNTNSDNIRIGQNSLKQKSFTSDSNEDFSKKRFVHDYSHKEDYNVSKDINIEPELIKRTQWEWEDEVIDRIPKSDHLKTHSINDHSVAEIETSDGSNKYEIHSQSKNLHIHPKGSCRKQIHEEYKSRPGAYQANPEEYPGRPEEYQLRPEEYQMRTEEYQTGLEEYQTGLEEYQTRPEEYQTRSETYQAPSDSSQQKPTDYQTSPENCQTIPEGYQTRPDPNRPEDFQGRSENSQTKCGNPSNDVFTRRRKPSYTKHDEARWDDYVSKNEIYSRRSERKTDGIHSQTEDGYVRNKDVCPRNEDGYARVDGIHSRNEFSYNITYPYQSNTNELIGTRRPKSYYSNLQSNYDSDYNMRSWPCLPNFNEPPPSKSQNYPYLTDNKYDSEFHLNQLPSNHPGYVTEQYSEMNSSHYEYFTRQESETVKGMKRKAEESEESEFESDSEDNPRLKEIIPVKINISQSKPPKRPKFIKPALKQPSVSTKLPDKPEDVFESVKISQNRKIELKVPSDNLEDRPNIKLTEEVGTFPIYEKNEGIHTLISPADTSLIKGILETMKNDPIRVNQKDRGMESYPIKPNSKRRNVVKDNLTEPLPERTDLLETTTINNCLAKIKSIVSKPINTISSPAETNSNQTMISAETVAPISNQISPTETTLSNPIDPTSLQPQFISQEELKSNRIEQKDLASLPVFKNYQPGAPTNRLYIKNIAKKVEVKDLEYIFKRYCPNEDSEFDIRLMQEGRMKGQAFITLSSIEFAQKALEETNGYILKDKPFVVAFARSAGPKK